MREVLHVNSSEPSIFDSACSQNLGSFFTDVFGSYSWPYLVKTFVGDPRRRQCSLLFEQGHFGRLIGGGCSWARIGIHIAEHNPGSCFLWLLLLPGGLIAEILVSNNGSRVFR